MQRAQTLEDMAQRLSQRVLTAESAAQRVDARGVRLEERIQDAALNSKSKSGHPSVLKIALRAQILKKFKIA